jgi:hypothetical protein
MTIILLDDSYLIALSVKSSSICDPGLFIAAPLARNMYENLLCCVSFRFVYVDILLCNLVHNF